MPSRPLCPPCSNSCRHAVCPRYSDAVCRVLPCTCEVRWYWRNRDVTARCSCKFSCCLCSHEMIAHSVRLLPPPSSTLLSWTSDQSCASGKASRASCPSFSSGRGGAKSAYAQPKYDRHSTRRGSGKPCPHPCQLSSACGSRIKLNHTTNLPLKKVPCSFTVSSRSSQPRQFAIAILWAIPTLSVLAM